MADETPTKSSGNPTLQFLIILGIIYFIFIYPKSSGSGLLTNDTVTMDTCMTDSDCACGKNIGTGACFMGNKNYVNSSAQCPDYCSGITGNQGVKCSSNKCVFYQISSIANPAATFCVNQGGTSANIETSSGQQGTCTVKGKTCDEWEFYNSNGANCTTIVTTTTIPGQTTTTISGTTSTTLYSPPMNIHLTENCTDSDTGIQPTNPGYVSYQMAGYPDACTSNVTVREWYCGSAVAKMVDVPCGNGSVCRYTNGFGACVLIASLL
jgi:putative hemolysin